MDHHELTNFLLKSNAPPSEAESKRFRELIQAEEAKYQSIAANVEALSNNDKLFRIRFRPTRMLSLPLVDFHPRSLPPFSVTALQ